VSKQDSGLLYGLAMLFECRNITYQYAEAESSVLQNLNCRLAEPGFHGLFGPSGVGKSTFARILSRELNNFSGDIITPELNRVLYSYNLERLPGWSGVGEHIAKVTPAGQQKVMQDLVESFGLASCLDSRFSQISLGQKNRINLTRYLLQDFELLIMDESLANVDEATREQIILKIKKMFPHRYFLYISHSVHEVSKFCKEILVLRRAGKRPQVVSVAGQNYMEKQTLNRNDLERTMLEIVHAS
jgi:ABC-type nitrate/sulfonate/bicarbonate transport system ATPase subunit